MNSKEILKDIGTRTNGDVYLGVVGPVRTGKSTFIKRFMEVAIIPEVKDEYVRGRMIDELPQSGAGKTIMTTEPKFVPATAADISINDEAFVKVRLVDCVGYVIKNAKGYEDENGQRMVKTPWLEEAIPFDQAAKMGTQKVIQEHSNIGIVITTDGTISELTREDYVDAENQVIEELVNLGKPFIIIVNSKYPTGDKAIETMNYLKGKYSVPIIPLSVEQMTNDDITSLLKEALYEFPVAKFDLSLPKWVATLNETHWLRVSIQETVGQAMQSAQKIRSVESIGDVMKQNEYITNFELVNIDMATGNVNVYIEVKEDLYDDIIREIAGFEISDRSELLNLVQQYTSMKNELDGIMPAIQMAKETGYGYTSPQMKDMVTNRPELSKQGTRYGVKITATVPSWHIIKVDIGSTFEPIIGSKEQGDYLLESLAADYDQDPNKLLESSLFGRKVGDVIKDGVNAKLMLMPDQSKVRLQQIVKTLANKGKGNLIAFII